MTYKYFAIKHTHTLELHTGRQSRKVSWLVICDHVFDKSPLCTKHDQRQEGHKQKNGVLGSLEVVDFDPKDMFFVH